ncbi:MAG: homoserine O-succinyltransferase, partial [Sphaerochaeta sp.]|nr:homoserine O-succinyltransferase [Sphaerochaeta sp.]
HYGVGKILLPKKLSGVYSHTVRQKNHPLVRGFDDRFWAPHSRNTAVDESRLSLEHDLVVLSDSEEAGLYLVVSQDGRKVFVTGHSEYDELTLHDEYQRDLAAGLSLEQPSHYYQGEEVQVRWRGHAHLLFSNWLNYHVYQSTPYQLEQLSKVLQHS